MAINRNYLLLLSCKMCFLLVSICNENNSDDNIKFKLKFVLEFSCKQFSVNIYTIGSMIVSKDSFRKISGKFCFKRFYAT